MSLKEKKLNYQMNRIVKGLNSSLNTPHEFYYAFQQFLAVIKNLLCELYMHNLVFPNNREWNPLMYVVGDIQLREFMS